MIPRVPLRLFFGIAGAALVLVGSVGLFGLRAPSALAAGATLTGGGSSFGALEMQQWTASVASNPYDLTVNYVTNSSGEGRSGFANGTYDYGMSDIPYPSPESSTLAGLQSGRCHGQTGTACFVYVPVTAGALAFPFSVSNNSGQPITNLSLTPDDVCKIFTGGITMWDDPELVATNSQLSGVSKQITAVVRSDPAGESYVLSQYCIAKDPGLWSAFMASCSSIRASNPDETCSSPTDPTSLWPGYLENSEQALSINGADPTANAVSQASAQNLSAITYVAAGYAVQRGLPMASVQNAAGKYIQPGSNAVSIALGYATARGDGTFNLNFNGPDPGAYFPSTYSYILAQTGGFDAAKGATLGKFICYDLGYGQQGVQVLKYAPLNSAVVAIAAAAEAAIPGGIPAASCTAGAPAAPPPPNVVPVSAATTVPAASGSASAASAATAGAAAAASGSNASAGATAGATATATGARSSGSNSASAGSGSGATLSAAALQAQAASANAKNGKGPSVLAPIVEGAAICGAGVAWAGLRKRGNA